MLLLKTFISVTTLKAYASNATSLYSLVDSSIF